MFRYNCFSILLLNLKIRKDVEIMRKVIFEGNSRITMNILKVSRKWRSKKDYLFQEIKL
jgi:hypothetical protein